MITARELVSRPFAEIRTDKESVLALIFYARGYSGTATIKICEKELQIHYNKIKKRVLEMENVEKKYILKKGLKYVRETAEHISKENLTDDKAALYLAKGFLKESDFDRLPKKEEVKPESTEDTKATKRKK